MKRRQLPKMLRVIAFAGATTAAWNSLAWLQPNTVHSSKSDADTLLRRSLLLPAIAAATLASAPFSASAFGEVKMPMSNIRYVEVKCDPNKGETLKGTKATYGLDARCVEVTATVTNPENKDLRKAGVFGRINDAAAATSVLANAMDGASDVGQFTLIDNIPPGTSDVQFRFVAALPKDLKGKPLPELEFVRLKATWYPGSIRWEPLTECELNPAAPGCDL